MRRFVQHVLRCLQHNSWNVAVQTDDEVVTSVAKVQAVVNCVVRVIEHVSSVAIITTQLGAGFRRRSRYLCVETGSTPDAIRKVWRRNTGRRDFRPPRRCKWDLRSFGISRSVECSSVPTFRLNLSVTSSTIKQFLFNHTASETRFVRPVPFLWLRGCVRTCSPPSLLGNFCIIESITYGVAWWWLALTSVSINWTSYAFADWSAI